MICLKWTLPPCLSHCDINARTSGVVGFDGNVLITVFACKQVTLLVLSAVAHLPLIGINRALKPASRFFHESQLRVSVSLKRGFFSSRREIKETLSLCSSICQVEPETHRTSSFRPFLFHLYNLLPVPENQTAADSRLSSSVSHNFPRRPLEDPEQPEELMGSFHRCDFSTLAFDNALLHSLLHSAFPLGDTSLRGESSFNH